MEGTAKTPPIPASRQAAARTRLAWPVRVKRPASAVLPLSQGIKTLRPSLFFHSPPSFLFPPATYLTLSWICAPFPPTIVDRPASTVHEAFRQTAFVSILGPSILPISRPRPSNLPRRIYGLSERDNRALSFAPLSLPTAATAQLERRWFHLGKS